MKRHSCAPSMWHSHLQAKMNIISASFGLVANAPWNPSYSSLIHNLNKVAELIILNIPFLS